MLCLAVTNCLAPNGRRACLMRFGRISYLKCIFPVKCLRRLDRYQPLHEVYRYLAEVAKNNDKVTVFDLVMNLSFHGRRAQLTTCHPIVCRLCQLFRQGTTHEGRKIKAVEIIGNPADKRLVWIDGCTHAR